MECKPVDLSKISLNFPGIPSSRDKIFSYKHKNIFLKMADKQAREKHTKKTMIKKYDSVIKKKVLSNLDELKNGGRSNKVNHRV